MTVIKKAVPFLLVVGIFLALTSAAAAQVSSGPQTINLSATLNESLTLTLSGGNAVSFTLTPGSATNPGSTNITATTSWVLKPGRTAVTVNAYFTSAAALTDSTSGVSIPNTAFTIADNGGAATALTGATPPFGAFGYQMQNIAITGSNKNSSITDNMVFNIDLSAGTLPQLPAGDYQGVLNIQAQATP